MEALIYSTFYSTEKICACIFNLGRLYIMYMNMSLEVFIHQATTPN